MIKRIELINFMSHAHTVIEPAVGTTVLAGPNNCGKSAVVVALQILCHNDTSTYVLKHEEKNCRIIVETNDGHVIEWSRKKNGSPKYLIDDRPYDRLGRSGVPPELHQVLRLPKVAADTSDFDIHFGEQKKPVFLLNDSPKAAAEFFASSSDSIRLVEMQALHKQNVRDAKREQKRLETERDEIEESLEKLGSIHDLHKQVEDCEKRFFNINLNDERIESAGVFLQKYQATELELGLLNAQAKGYSNLQSPPDYADESALQQLTESLELTQSQVDQNVAMNDAFGLLEHPPALSDETTLEELIEQLSITNATVNRLELDAGQLGRLTEFPQLQDLGPLNELIDATEAQIKKVERLNAELAAVDEKFNNSILKIQSWAKANPTCPTCNGVIDVENLISGDSNHECQGVSND